ncbi:MAG: hypothetical protein FJ033_02500 [Chloroflexi bacterium]|nr:hypothetical protein [Chloroflexota bacterium]
MERFAIVLFRLIAPDGNGGFLDVGGGVVLLAEPRPENWHMRFSAIARKRFRRILGACVESGYATLNRGLVESYCHFEEGIFWQGGER